MKKMSFVIALITCIVSTNVTAMSWFSGLTKKDFQFLKTSITSKIYTTDKKIEQLNTNTDPNGFKQVDPQTGDSLLHIAAEEGELEILESLLNHLDITIKNKNGDTLLHAAAQGTNPEKQDDIIDFLINKDLDINAQNNDKNTPLFLAIENGNLELVKKLVEKHNADITHKNLKNDGALLYALQFTNPSITSYIAQKLIEKSYEIQNITNKNDKTTLMIAVENGDLGNVKALLNAIKNRKKRQQFINKVNNKKLNALHYIGLGYDKLPQNKKTTQHKKDLLEITQLLLDNGGNVAQESGDIKVGTFHGSGRNPAGVASYAGLDDVNKLMVKKLEIKRRGTEFKPGAQIILESQRKKMAKTDIQNLTNALAQL